MAIYSCNLSSVGRTTHAAGTAGCHLAYVGREGADAHLEAHCIPLDPTAARAWMDREEVHDRANARLIDKVRVAIPRELNRDQRADLVRNFVRGITRDRVPWLFGIHQDGKDEHNPHAHIVLRDRDIETGRRVLLLSSSAKDREKLGLEPKAVEWIRERWEHHANAALERAGVEARIDRRTLEAQGIDREPMLHLGPRAQHIERFVERPSSKKRVNALGREVDYPAIDAGKTRRERNAEIIDLNLERRTRSPDLETRVWAQFERGQRQLDDRLERALAEQARRRTKDERALNAEFRSKVREIALAKKTAYLDGIKLQRTELAPRRVEMRSRHRDERDAMHRTQTSFWSRLCRAIDITGSTRRRHQAARRDLVAAHKDERADLARVSSAAKSALRDRVTECFAPAHGHVIDQRKLALSSMRAVRLQADAMDDMKRQLREAHRERDRLRTMDLLMSIRPDPRHDNRKPLEARLQKARDAARAFRQERSTAEGRSSPSREHDGPARGR